MEKIIISLQNFEDKFNNFIQKFETLKTENSNLKQKLNEQEILNQNLIDENNLLKQNITSQNLELENIKINLEKHLNQIDEFISKLSL